MRRDLPWSDYVAVKAVRLLLNAVLTTVPNRSGRFAGERDGDRDGASVAVFSQSRQPMTTEQSQYALGIALTSPIRA
jgi:hypothetical protein